ncbi:MAG: nicotinamide mononucleotide transporter, partial [Bacteroidales bacterium]|nr:nicotinamide mononucleotide transporter [Bacteroidales bacterium]
MEIYMWLQDNLIEIFGALAGIVYVVLEIRQNLWLWPVGIITSGVYIWVFFSGKLYADMSLQGYYLVISVMGWYWWGRRRKGRRGEGESGSGSESESGSGSESESESGSGSGSESESESESESGSGSGSESEEIPCRKSLLPDSGGQGAGYEKANRLPVSRLDLTT